MKKTRNETPKMKADGAYLELEITDPSEIYHPKLVEELCSAIEGELKFKGMQAECDFGFDYNDYNPDNPELFHLELNLSISNLKPNIDINSIIQIIRDLAVSKRVFTRSKSEFEKDKALADFNRTKAIRDDKYKQYLKLKKEFEGSKR